MTENGKTYMIADQMEHSFYFGNSSPVIINSILWNNAINNIYMICGTDSQSITVAYSDIDGGQSSLVTGDHSGVNWLDGNINLDPLFSDAEHNYYFLLANSPCIDVFIKNIVNRLGLRDRNKLLNAIPIGR